MPGIASYSDSRFSRAAASDGHEDPMPVIVVITARIIGFALMILIRALIGIAALAAGMALPIGMMAGIRDGWFN